MEEFSKNRIILISVIVNIIFLILVIKFGAQARNIRVALDKERILRFTSEESAGKSESKIKALGQALEEESVAHQATKKALVETAAELEKMTELKETLEEDLKEELIKNKSNINRERK